MQRLIAGLLLVSVTLFGGNIIARISGEGVKLANLERAFIATGAVQVDLNMNGWAQVGATEMSETQLKGLLRAASQAAFGVIPAKITYYEDSGTRIAQATYTAGKFNIEANAQSLLSNGKYENYLIATVQTSEGTIEEMERTLKNFFKAAGTKPELTTCLVGVIKGRISPEQATAIIGKVLGVLRAELQESYSDGNVINVIGYSPELPGGIKMAGRTSNLSLTMRFNADAGNTWLWLAWPTFALPI